MKKTFSKYGVYILIIIVVLASSISYKVVLYNKGKHEAEAESDKAGKDIVTVWMKDTADSETRGYQVDKFNKQNKNNIYIDFKTCKNDDYSNMLRISLAADKKPDIFQYGYFDLIKRDQLLSLDEVGLDTDKLNKDNIFYYNKTPYGVRLSGNSVKFAWNKDIFKSSGLDPEKGPKNWDEVIEYASKIKAAHPEVVPFEFPLYTFNELKISIGEPSVGLGSIYTTFWDYKKGEYNFDYAKDILNVYKKMYSLDLINEDFDKHTRDSLRRDFYCGNTAMILSTYEDKYIFSNKLPLGFNVGISDLPSINNKENQNYYYVDNFNCLMVNKDIKNKDAVLDVYKFFLDEDVNKELLKTRTVLPLNIDDKSEKDNLYPEYNSVDKFKNETYDPTIFINHDGRKVGELYTYAIKGEMGVDEVTKELNDVYGRATKAMENNEQFDFSYYTIK